MNPRETFNLAMAIQHLALISYWTQDKTDYPNSQIALDMGKIAGLSYKIKRQCRKLDPSIEDFEY